MNREEKSYYVPPPNRDFSSTGDISRLSETANWQDKKSERRKGEVASSWVTENSEKKEIPKEKFKFDYNFQSNFEFLNEKNENSSPSDQNNPFTDQNSSPSPSNQSNNQNKGNDQALE